MSPRTLGRVGGALLAVTACGGGDDGAAADPTATGPVTVWLSNNAEEVAWGTQPPGTAWLVDFLELDKGGVAYVWRSREDPVANHHIREPVRFWSLDGIEEGVLAALAERRLDEVRAAASASAPKPSTNSAWIRMTRHGSVWTQSASKFESSSRWSVVVRGTCLPRSVTAPLS